MTLRLMMIRIGLKRSVANRYAFGFYLFGNLISIAVMFFLWQSVLRHRPSAVFAETITYLIFMQLLTAVFPKTSFAIHDDIRTGNIARLLLRPVPLLTHYFWESVGYSFGKLIFIGILDVILLVAVRQSALAWQTLPLLVIAVMLGYVLYFELEAIIGLFSFYTYSIWGINTFKAAVLLAVSGNVFPVNFYPAAVKTIAQFLPFQYAFGAIGKLLSQQQAADFWPTLFMQSLYIATLFGVYHLQLKIAIQRVVIQGG